MLDPDPDEMNADPQPWSQQYDCFLPFRGIAGGEPATGAGLENVLDLPHLQERGLRAVQPHPALAALPPRLTLHTARGEMPCSSFSLFSVKDSKYCGLGGTVLYYMKFWVNIFKRKWTNFWPDAAHRNSLLSGEVDSNPE